MNAPEQPAQAQAQAAASEAAGTTQAAPAPAVSASPVAGAVPIGPAPGIAASPRSASSPLSAVLRRLRRPAARASLREWCVLAALLALLCGALGYVNGLGRPDATLYDAAINLSPHAPRPDIVIVAIDEASLAQIGRWPWPRAVHAALLDRIAPGRPKAIAMDMILSEPEPSSPGARGLSGDAALAQAIGRAGNVVLPVLSELNARGELHTSLPVAPLMERIAALGHIHLEIDPDSIARSVFLREGLGAPGSGQAEGWPHFALALHDLGAPSLAPLPGERNADPARAGTWSRDYWIHIPFAGPPGTFGHVSYVEVLKGRVDAQAFAGKFVLVGATASGLSDSFPTPVSGQSRPMPGIEVSANVLNTLLEGSAIVRAPAWANALFSMLPVLLLMVALLLLTPRRGLFAAALSVLLTLGASFALFRAGLWFAPAGSLAGLVIAYPLWSWRRLEATVQYLGDEFLRMSAEPRILPEDPYAGARPGADLVERRILAMESATSRLRSARRFVSDTLESLPDATLIADREGIVLIANRAAAHLFGVATPKVLHGQRVSGLLGRFAPKADPVHPLSWETLQALAQTPDAASGTRASMELATREERDLLARCAAFENAAGETSGWIISLVDISPLREAERARDEVLSFLSHDMRSPQSSILALIELHELDPKDNPKEEVHTRIAQYAHRTLDLSEQFLQLARAETKDYELEVIDLAMIAEDAVEEVWTAAGQKRIKLALQTDGEPVPVKADGGLLRRALTNLLTNAVKYSPEGTTTTVTVEMRDGWAQCIVADQGYGMTAENLEDLFKRFRRFSRPGQPKAQGAGLGMAFVKTVAERHGGSLLVASTPDVGTTFTLQLPPAP